MSIEERIEVIEQRNKRVTDDKAWETSLLRRLLVAVITYVLVGVYLIWLDVARPWLNAFVPVVGFLLSTLALQWAKKIWLERR